MRSTCPVVFKHAAYLRTTLAYSVLGGSGVSSDSTSTVTRVLRPRVGCSGWNYASWRGRFYPTALSAADWLDYYSSRLDTVEVNNTFYRLPERSTFAAWKTQVPRGFLMAVKASRFLTHMKRLLDPEEPLQRLFSRAAALGRTLGPVLYQLPGNFSIDLARLDRFLERLPKSAAGTRIRHVMEFRHRSWYVTETFALLTQYGVTLCLHDKRDSGIAQPFVGPNVYVRFHGTSGTYDGSYSTRQLDRWAHRLAEQAQDKRQVFAYFNNDPDAVAVANAFTLRKQIARLV
jgi:uncharacterized protein YecE (DUF72 family)